MLKINAIGYFFFQTWDRGLNFICLGDPPQPPSKILKILDLRGFVDFIQEFDQMGDSPPQAGKF